MAYTDDEIRRQLRLGEDSAWEFKSVDFRSSDPARRRRDGWADEIAAFANARGGVLLLGVTDAGDVPGMSRGQLDALERQVREICTDSIRPVIRIETYRRELDGRSFLLVSIPEGDAQHDSPGGSFVRVGSAKQRMSSDERMRLAQRRGQARFSGFDEQTVTGADVLALFPNNTWKRSRTDADGEARLDLHSVHLPMTVFVAREDHAAHVERGWLPMERALAVELAPKAGGGSAVFAESTGHLPGLAGRLNPILDTSHRTYLFASNIAINGGKQQPVPFVPGEEDLHLTDADGRALLVRVAAVAGQSSVLDYGPA